MIDPASPDSPPDTLRVRDFYLGRQPILDRQSALFGYELLFRNAATGPAQFDTDLTATASVIAHAAQLGLDRVMGDALAFINVDAAVLASDIFVFLPREKVVLEVEQGSANDATLGRIGELRGHGFRFALDADPVSDPSKLLPLFDYVKMDLRRVPVAQLAHQIAPFKGRKLLAQKVETRDEFQACLDLGFDYFQGFYFAKPAVISGKKLSPAQRAVVELMTLITSDAENAAIEKAVKKDVPLALNLLRLVNTPAVGIPRRIDSVAQALMILGRRQLQRWLQIMLYAEPAKRAQGMTPVLMLATTRGRLLELLAQRLRPSQRGISDIAFTVGIMSLMDALFGIPMDEVVGQIPVSDEIREALLDRTGFFGELLKLTECLERMDDMVDQVMPTLKELAIGTDELVELEMAAFQWSDTVVRYAI
jgi:EAL and modified HD-GYP domain-containing signal transduction protein